MVDFVLSLPGWCGALVAMLITTAGGLLVYGLAYKFISSYQGYDLRDPVTSLFRMVGILVSLMLSLAFGEVIGEWKATKKAIDREVVAISDIYHGMRFYDVEATREIQQTIIDYTQAIIDDDWPAMAKDRFGQRASELRMQITKMVVALEPANPAQKELMASITADLDALSDFRLVRLSHTLSKPPVYVFVIVFGFLVSMACFGAYRPQPALIALVSLYTAFIGLVLYLVMSLTDPFHGGNIIDPLPFEYMVEVWRAAN